MRIFFMIYIPAMVLLLGIAIGGFINAVTKDLDTAFKEGRAFENERLWNCYADVRYSGVAWEGDKKYFICSHEIPEGKVYYKKQKGV